MRHDRARQRKTWNRIVTVSIVVAVVVHVVVIVWGPTFDIEAPWRTGGPLSEESPSNLPGVFVDVFFHPPEIFGDDGDARPEPPERFLEAEQVDVRPALLSHACGGRSPASILPVSGRARIRVDEQGNVVHAVAAEPSSSGDACGDAIVVGVALALWYRWLPNEEYPAPVELIQPMSVF